MIKESDFDYAITAREVELPETTTERFKLLGSSTSNLEPLKRELNLTISESNGKLYLEGLKVDVDDGVSILNQMKQVLVAKPKVTFTEQDIVSAINLRKHGEVNSFSKLYDKPIFKTINGERFYAKSPAQQEYIDNIRNNTITFGMGSFGSGKSMLAVIEALNALNHHEVEKIVVTRPVVATEDIGFLPGTMEDKMLPYVKPIYDYFERFVGKPKLEDMLYNGTLEVAPLAFMRGSTFDNTFLINDEFQNATFSQIKLLLSRIGFNTKVVVTGDLNQIDLKPGQSGLEKTVNLLEGHQDIKVSRFGKIDIMRSPIVKELFKIFEEEETKK